MPTINVYQLVSPATMYRNRFALKAVFDYAWKGSHEVEVDKTTGFLYVRRKGVSNIGLPIIEEKAKQKVQQLFSAFDAACAKHKELQKTGVKELFGNLKLVNAVQEADDSFAGLGNVRMYFMSYLKISAKGGDAPVMGTTVSVKMGRNYQIIELQYNLLPVKQVIESIAISPVKSNHSPDMLYRRAANNLLAPYYAY